MVSVVISELGGMQLIFVKPGTKIDDAYSRDELLMELLPAPEEASLAKLG